MRDSRRVAVAVSAAPIALAVAWLGSWTLRAVLARVGHPGAPLDDAYIHFQYARAIAEGHPLRFFAGAPITSGSTSLLWPALLAPFWLLGARDESIVWVAWALSYAALGGLAWEAQRLTEPLAGAAAGVGAAAMTLAFGGFAWCAASGMEIVPFAWAIARATRRSAEWAEGTPDERTRGRRVELVALAWASTLLRPEGAVTSALVAVTLAVCEKPPLGPPIAMRSRLATRVADNRLAAAFAASVIPLVPLVLWITTGSPTTTTAVAKLLPGNPYYSGAALLVAASENVRLFVTSLIAGEPRSAEFVPHGGAAVAFAGLGAVLARGVRTRLWIRAAGVLAIALTMFAPCFYLTFLWNRLRYLWPFATGWIVGVACLARVLGDGAARIRPRWRRLTAPSCGVVVGLFASKLEGVVDDVAQSVSAIDRQQVALGRWAREQLPSSASIGVNDTGAIAYFGEHRTFDIVGLTTAGEARYWVAGPASRFEHYEHLQKTRPGSLPTHFIVYPEWMALPALLGEPLHEATVTDSTIVGGRTMRAYLADWSALGSGEHPWTVLPGEELDVMDVADIDCESAHEYELLGAREGEQVVEAARSSSGRVVVDGGRGQRTRESFVARLPPGARVRGVVRLAGPPLTRVRVACGGREVARFMLGDDSAWTEQEFDLPEDDVGPATRVELLADDPVTVYHYWFLSMP